MNFLKREFSKREKILILTGGVLMVFIAIKILFFPLMERRQAVGESLAMRTELLERTKKAIKMRPQMEEKRRVLRETVKNLEGALLVGKSPTLASAELQSLMKEIAQRSGVQIKSIKTLKSEDLGEYIKVQGEIIFYADIRSLLNFLYNIEDNEKALVVTQMNLVLQNSRGVSRLQSTVRVSAGGKGGEGAPRVKPLGRHEAKTGHQQWQSGRGAS